MNIKFKKQSYWHISGFYSLLATDFPFEWLAHWLRLRGERE